MSKNYYRKIVVDGKEYELVLGQNQNSTNFKLEN